MELPLPEALETVEHRSLAVGMAVLRRPIFCTSEGVYIAFVPFKVEFSPGRITSGAGQPIAERGMGSTGVVFKAPAPDHDLRLLS